MAMNKRIESIARLEDGMYGDVFWEAWLKPGWCWGEQGLHVWHEDTKKEIMDNAWKIKECCCKECDLSKQQLYN